MKKLSSITSEAAKAAQAASKGFYASFSRVSRSASENRTIRKMACRMFSVPGCLKEGTLIWMADGSVRPIETVHNGDWVMSVSQKEGDGPSARIVESRVMTFHDRLLGLSVDLDGDRVSDLQIQATGEHPFYVKGKGWTRADALCKEDALQTDSGPTAVVLDATTIEGASVAYNLDVGEPDSFFVWSEKGAVLTQNLEGEVYLYGDKLPSGRTEGFLNLETNKWKTNSAHHLYWNAWLEKNYDIPLVALKPTYTLRTQFPCIELPTHIHSQAHEYMEQTWFKVRFNGRRSNDLTIDEWKSIKLY